MAGGDPSLFDLQLQLRYLAGPLMALFLIGAAGAPLRPLAVAVSVPLFLTPLALDRRASSAPSSRSPPTPRGSGSPACWLRRRRDSVRHAAFLMLALAAGLVGVALLIVPDATGAFFAWGLAPASLAAFAGGVYVGSAVVYAVALRAPAREAHGLVVAAVVLSVSVLASTLAHLDVFDFGRLQAWAWVALFAAFGDRDHACSPLRGPWWPAPGPRLPLWARGLLGAAALAARRRRRRAVDRPDRVLAAAARRPLRGLVGRHARHARRLRGARATAAARRGCRRSRSSSCRPARWSPPRAPTADPGYVLALALLVGRRRGGPRGQRGTGWRGS